MELLTPHDWPVFLIEATYRGFFLFTIICLILRLFKKRKISRHAVNVQYSANFVLAIVTVLEILISVQFYYETYVEYEQWEFSVLPAMKPYVPVMVASLLLQWVIGLLFFIRRLRVSWLLSLLVLLLMNAEYIIGVFILIEKDYSPSSWTLLENENDWLFYAGKILLFTILTFLAYLFFYKRKKLPCP